MELAITRMNTRTSRPKPDSQEPRLRPLLLQQSLARAQPVFDQLPGREDWSVPESAPLKRLGFYEGSPLKAVEALSVPERAPLNALTQRLHM